jgi:hypothetical protein
MMDKYRIVSEIRIDYGFGDSFLAYFYISNNCNLINDIIINNIKNSYIFEFYSTTKTEYNQIYKVDFAEGFYLKYIDL